MFTFSDDVREEMFAKLISPEDYEDDDEEEMLKRAIAMSLEEQ